MALRYGIFAQRKFYWEVQYVKVQLLRLMLAVSSHTLTPDPIALSALKTPKD